MINVAIADDHPLVREGIKRALQKEIDIEVVSEAADGNELLENLQETSPHIAILDITMPGKSGLDLLKDIKARFPDLPVLILSIHPPQRFAIRALKAGAQGYLCKTSISEELVKAIHRIIKQKRKYITEEVADQLAQQVDPTNAPTHESLSDREFQVMCMIADGKEVSTIAEELSLSPHTIHTYRSRIKEKMNLESDVAMTRYAINNDLIY
jgi:DNA-binding NarL/FixJ family response regulator